DMNSSDAKEFTGVNNEMRFRIQMTQDPMLNNTPVIENISFDIMYIPQNIEVWLETSYHMDIPDKGLDFTIHLVYDQPSMPIYYVGYFDDSTHIAYAGFQATSTTFDSMPDKVVHMTMGEDHESILGFHITFEESGMAFSTSLFIVLLFIIITMGAVGFYFKGRPKDSEAAKTDTVEDDEGDDDAPVKVKGKTVTTMQTGSIEKGPDTPLIKRRLVLVEMISRLEREVDGGLMNPDSAARMKASYQKELDEIDDKLADTPSPELEELASKKAQMIDKLKTLDEQLEKGEITSEDHEILQTNYKKKAIDIMKQMDEIS
ncbi:MAG: hypothetical protein KAS16_06720, partial [Thermoplasmata archaeon]|nr:hypothetical protein [Thermoplasmata archaeon]